MPEHLDIPESEFQRPVLVDPDVADVLARARDFQRELDLLPNGYERAEEVISILNLAWPHRQEIVFATGKITSGVVEVADETDDYTGESRTAVGTLLRDDGEQQSCTFFSRDQEFTSFGFNARPEPMVMASGEVIGTRYVLQYALQREVYVGLPNSKERLVRMDCSSDLDEVSLEFTHDSFAFAEIKAREYFPECVEELDAKIMDDALVADNIMALKGISVAAPRYIGENEAIALEQYVDELISADKEEVPFLIQLQDGAVIFDSEDRKEVVHTLRYGTALLISVLGIRVVAQMDIDEEGEPTIDPDNFEFRLAFQSHGEVEEDDSGEVEVRVRDVEVLINVRQQFHKQQA